MIKRYILLLLYYIIIFLILFVIFPIIIVAILAIITIDKHSPFYLEERSGLFGKSFVIIKLRTMKLNHSKIPTKLGRFLRLLKIDELPQIFNVILGQMSLVGPRPLYMSYNKKFSNFEIQRLNVKPGITGLAQIKVIDTNNWRSKFKYDVFYSKHKSISFDLYILCKTLFFYLNVVISNKIIIENHNRFDD